MKIISVSRPEQLGQARRLFEEYAASLSFDLCFQNFQQELESLPGDYAPPGGGLWVAIADSGEPAGCVGLRRLDVGMGEMKRLYVRPAYRGTGLGKRLALKVLEEASVLGYHRIRLDTTPEMTAAIRLYKSLGFTRIDPYRPNPIEGAVYMEFEVDEALQRPMRIAAEQVELVVPLFDAYRQFYGQPSNLAGARQFLVNRLISDESVIFAAVENDKALGFIQLFPSFSSVSMMPIWILNDLFVAKESRRRGIARRLLAAARNHAFRTGAARLVLATSALNAEAQSLYERNGWQRDTAFLHYEYILAR